MTIQFSSQQFDDLIAALRAAPYCVADPLISHLRSETTRLYNEQYDKRREPNQEIQHHSV